MPFHALRTLAPRLVPLMVFSVFAAGCAGSLRPAAAPPAPLPDENAAFTVNAAPTEVLDAATVALVNSNFSIALTNERIGLLQTEFVPLASVQAAHRDSAGQALRLDRLQMRVTVTVQERAGAQLVQVKGSFQRTGRATDVDGVLARYWLERVTQDFADALGASYRPRVTDADYAGAVAQVVDARNGAPSATGHNVVRAVAIVAVLLFVATLVTGVLSPGTADGTGS